MDTAPSLRSGSEQKRALGNWGGQSPELQGELAPRKRETWVKNGDGISSGKTSWSRFLGFEGMTWWEEGGFPHLMAIRITWARGSFNTCGSQDSFLGGGGGPGVCISSRTACNFYNQESSGPALGLRRLPLQVKTRLERGRSKRGALSQDGRDKNSVNL